jgi:hypothetical protein
MEYRLAEILIEGLGSHKEVSALEFMSGIKLDKKAFLDAIIKKEIENLKRFSIRIDGPNAEFVSNDYKAYLSMDLLLNNRSINNYNNNYKPNLLERFIEKITKKYKLYNPYVILMKLRSDNNLYVSLLNSPEKYSLLARIEIYYEDYLKTRPILIIPKANPSSVYEWEEENTVETSRLSEPAELKD